MKRELERTIRQLCREAGSAAAEAKADALCHDLTKQYDERVAAGMAELDAYRDVLKNIDQIKQMLASLPKEEKAEEWYAQETGRKNLERILGKISSCMWLCTVIVFFLLSFWGGIWSVSWLIFLWSSMGQTLLDMVKKINRGKPKKKVLKSGLTSLLWIGTVILYFLFSFATGAWHLSWLIFLVAALLQTFFSLFFGD